MSNHRDRMNAVFGGAIPPQGAKQREQFEKHLRDNPNPRQDREIRKLLNYADSNLQAQLHNGVDLVGSKTLRAFLHEYNNRAHIHDIHSLPVSFSVLEAFYSYTPSLNTFFLLSEEDHACSLADFLDYYTAHKVPELPLALAGMRPDLIHTFEFVDPPHFRFSGSEGTYIIRAANIIRRGSEISICILGGELIDPNEERKALEEMTFGEVPLWKASMAPLVHSQIGQRKPVLLDGTREFLRILFLCRFNLQLSTRELVVYMRDTDTSYLTLTDDPGAFLDILTGKSIAQDDEIKKMQESVRKMSTLSEIASIMLFIPWYLEAHVENCTIENHATQLRTWWSKSVNKKRTRLVEPELRRFTRPVRVLPTEQRDQNSVFSINPPDLHVESSGYWQRLDPWKEGRDRYGNPIVGKTWVTKRLEWVERPIATGLRATAVKPPMPEGRDPGMLYVMRSAAHPVNVFKIGLTRRSVIQRAAELSSGSGVPDALLPVFSFAISDCGQLEKVVHRALSAYRLRQDREFFQIELQHLHSVIVGILREQGEQY